MEDGVGRSLSVIKRARQNQKRRAINSVYREKIKEARKNIKKLIEAKASKEELLKALAAYSSSVDKALKKNILHKNNAARKKSRMNSTVKKIATSGK